MKSKETVIQTLAIFSENEDDKLSYDRWDHYSFKLNEVSDYNITPSGETTVSLKNGSRWTVAIKYEHFNNIMNENYNIINMVDAKANYEFKEQR